MLGKAVTTIFRLLLGLSTQLVSQRREFLRYQYPLSPFRIQEFILRSPVLVSIISRQAVLLSYQYKHIYGKTPSLHEHYSASSLLWASPNARRNHREVIDSPTMLGYIAHLVGSPKFHCHPVGIRCPQSPRRALWLLIPVASPQVAGFNLSDDMTTLIFSITRLITGSLTLRLMPSPPEASEAQLLILTLIWLLYEQAIVKINSFQFTRLTWLNLAHQRTQRLLI